MLPQARWCGALTGRTWRWREIDFCPAAVQCKKRLIVGGYWDAEPSSRQASGLPSANPSVDT